MCAFDNSCLTTCCIQRRPKSFGGRCRHQLVPLMLTPYICLSQTLLVQYCMHALNIFKAERQWHKNVSKRWALSHNLAGLSRTWSTDDTIMQTSPEQDQFNFFKLQKSGHKCSNTTLFYFISREIKLQFVRLHLSAMDSWFLSLFRVLLIFNYAACQTIS